MKRLQGGIAGWCVHPAPSRDVAGVSESSSLLRTVASFVDAEGGDASERPLGPAAADSLAREFSDFMNGVGTNVDAQSETSVVDLSFPGVHGSKEWSVWNGNDGQNVQGSRELSESDASVPDEPADPVFQERLRRRLWRLHLMTRPPASRFDGH